MRTQDAEVADLVEDEVFEDGDASLQAALAPNANTEVRKRKSKPKPR